MQYSEQPLAVWDFDNLARLRDKVELPICADELVFDYHDALKLIRAGAADYLNIRLGRGGGIHATDEPGHGPSIDEAQLRDKVTI